MLIPTAELGRFDSMVMPFELEAYDVLKSRSSKQKNLLNKLATICMKVRVWILCTLL